MHKRDKRIKRPLWKENDLKKNENVALTVFVVKSTDFESWKLNAAYLVGRKSVFRRIAHRTTVR